VSVVIPGASAVQQVESNVKASELPPLKRAQMKKASDIYEKYFKNPVHYLW
jgi:aryl-alcohol dehydrogenase-like predicted oxidoreductase